MKPSEVQVIRRVIVILSSMIEEPQECVATPWHSPVRSFAVKYLCPDPHSDLTSAEAWKFFQEVVEAGELTPVNKAIFLRQLPTILGTLYGLRKSHHIERTGRRQRGFKGISIRMFGEPTDVLEGDVK